MRDDQPIVLKGTIVRYDHGPSALGIVCDYTIGCGASVAYYHMTHCLGGMISRYRNSLTVATGQEVLDFWKYRKQYKLPEITIDDVPQSPEGYAAWEKSNVRLAAMNREMELKLCESEAFRTLQRMAGYVENGTDETVTIYQDDATKTWHVKVGIDMYSACIVRSRSSKSAFGDTLVHAIENFKINHPTHFED